MRRLCIMEKALEAMPGSMVVRQNLVTTCNKLAWALATCPQPSIRNGGRAVELALRASQLSGGENPIILQTLAAAYAEVGRYHDATATAQHALGLAAAQDNAALSGNLQTQIGLYQSGSPFRDSSLTTCWSFPVINKDPIRWKNPLFPMLPCWRRNEFQPAKVGSEIDQGRSADRSGLSDLRKVILPAREISACIALWICAHGRQSAPFVPAATPVA